MKKEVTYLNHFLSAAIVNTSICRLPEKVVTSCIMTRKSTSNFRLFLALLVVACCPALITGHVRRRSGVDDAHFHHHHDGDSEEKLGETKFIDLSHAFNNDTAVWPGRKVTFYTEFERRDSNGIWTASKGFCTSEHTSTHIDAPYHFNENGRRLHEIPFEDLIDIPGVMIDIYDKVHRYKNGRLTVIENYGLTREDVIAWEEKNGRIPQGAVVLLRTGWDTRWGDPRRFRGENIDSPPQPPEPSPDKSSEDEDNEVAPHKDKPKVSKQFYDSAEAWLSTELSFPAYAESAAKFLAVERAVRGVGVDVISIDPGNQNVLSPAHRVFANRNIYMLEMVANLHQLPPRGFNLWMMPFKIDRGTGAPTRIVAKLND